MPRARLGILSGTKMTRFVSPRLASKLWLLLKSRALIKEGSDRMLHEILVDVITDREARRSNALFEVHDRIPAWRFDLRKVEPPRPVPGSLIRAPIVPDRWRSRLDNLAGWKLNQCINVSWRKLSEAVVAHLRIAYDGNLSRFRQIAELIDNDYRDRAIRSCLQIFFPVCSGKVRFSRPSLRAFFGQAH